MSMPYVGDPIQAAEIEVTATVRVLQPAPDTALEHKWLSVDEGSQAPALKLLTARGNTA
jgi:hypothetical protein